MIKKKPICKKGINKAAGFPGCGSEAWKLNMGLCPACEYDFYTKDERGKILYQQKRNSLNKKNWKQEKKVLQENTKTLSSYKNDLQKEINTIIRLIDLGHGCIATGSTDGKMNAGHYIGVGANNTLRYHLENIWLQSEHSNMWKSGDTLRYQDGLIILYGKKYLERLNCLKSISPIKLNSEDIKSKISICRGIIKWLKLQDKIFSIEERLSLRLRFNDEIGIY